MRIPWKSPTKSGNQGEEPEKVKLFLDTGIDFLFGKTKSTHQRQSVVFCFQALEATGLVFVLIILSLFVFFQGEVAPVTLGPTKSRSSKSYVSAV
jgi:hypothetical protein